MIHMDCEPAAHELASRLREGGLKADIQVEADVGYSGGGALPGEGLPTHVVAIRGPDAQALAKRLRHQDPPVVARVARDALLLDPRTVLPEETEALCACVLRACAL